MRYTEVAPDQGRRTRCSTISTRIPSISSPTTTTPSREPSVLPAKFPNLLVNGAGGIAVGMATNIPPHNLGEVIDACVALIDDPALGIDDLINIIPGPDFPTGGIILGRQGIRSAYHLGRGSIVMRGKVSIDTIRKDREAIMVSEIPYQVNKASMVERIAELVREKKIEGISDLRDESDRDGFRVVIELKRDAVPEVVLNQLYRFTPLQTNFGANMVALDAGRPQVMNLKDLLTLFIAFREQVVTRRTKFLLNKARDRAHILVGLAIAVANIDEIIRVIRTSPDPNTARETLMSRDWPAKDVAAMITLIDDPRHRLTEDGTARLSMEQAKAILDLRLQRLTALGREEISEELDKLAVEIADYLDILRSRARVQTIIKGELAAVKSEFATPRKTVIIEQEGEVEDEDLIQREDMVVTVSHAGYVKRVPLSTYRAQKRGGKGRAGMQTREEDFVIAAVRGVHPHAGAVLLVTRSGLQGKGLAAAGRAAERPRQGDDQHPAARTGRAHHHHHAAARGRIVLGQPRRDVRDHRRHGPAQQAVRLRRRPSLRHHRHEARRGRGDRRRADLHRARRRAADRRRRPVHPLPGDRRARVQGPHIDGRARHRVGRGRQADLAGDPASRRCRRRTNARPTSNAPRRAVRRGERRAEEAGDARAEEASGAIELGDRALRRDGGAEQFMLTVSARTATASAPRRTNTGSPAAAARASPRWRSTAATASWWRPSRWRTPTRSCWSPTTAS